MESRDLRVCNYVQDNNGFIFKVVSIHDDGTVYCDFEGNEGDVWEFNKNNPCQGIELTEEILLKCGFVRDDFNKNGGLYLLLKNTCLDGHLDYFYLKKGLNVVNLRSIRSVEIKHLHQLQNLYFALCNEELNVQL